MEKTAISGIDFESLEEQLYQFLQSDAIALRPLEVNCSLLEKTLIIIIRFFQTPILETTLIFSLIQGFLDLQDISFLYPYKIYLTVDETSSLITTEGEIDYKTAITANFPLQNRDQVALVRRKISVPSLFARNSLRSPHLSRKITSDPFSTKSVLGLALGFGIIVLGLYGLSDFCVTENCPPLAKAEFLTQNSLLTFNPESSTGLLEAKQKFSEALEQLQSIPWWSPSLAKATRLATEYQKILKEIDLINAAIATSNQAIFLMKKSSLSMTEWQTAQNLLQKAIDQLRQFSPKSKFQAFAIAKQQEYKQILRSTNKRLQQEEQANISYDQSMKLARLAKVQEHTAQSSEDFGVIASTLKKAIRSLQTIVEGTTPYHKTAKLLDLYSQEFKNIETRKNQEEMATTAYQQAIQEAKKAEKAETLKQWSMSVSHWNNALVYLKQISANTFKGIKAKPIITSYTLSLKQAKANLMAANLSQNIRNNLTKICSQQGKICDYSINNKGIKVKLTSSYLQKIWDLSIQAKIQSNIQEQAGILNHLSRLEQSFQIISNTAELPLEVYNFKGNLMTTYTPIRINP